MHNNKMRRRWALGLAALALGVAAAGTAENVQADEVLWTQGETASETTAQTVSDSVPMTGREESEVLWT